MLFITPLNAQKKPPLRFHKDDSFCCQEGGQSTLSGFSPHNIKTAFLLSSEKQAPSLRSPPAAIAAPPPKGENHYKSKTHAFQSFAPFGGGSRSEAETGGERSEGACFSPHKKNRPCVSTQGWFFLTISQLFNLFPLWRGGAKRRGRCLNLIKQQAAFPLQHKPLPKNLPIR